MSNQRVGDVTGPIDAVITWVDGSDPVHAEKRQMVLKELGRLARDIIPAGIDMTRFSNNDEIKYCVYSIRKFAPWIRTIFLVTDRQCPGFLTSEVRHRLGVVIVDHRDIFDGHDDVLPTFNSLSIETVLYRIPGLSDQFVYFNDDFILLRPVKPSDFFMDDSVVLRGSWGSLARFGLLRLWFSSVLNVVLKKLLGINRAMSVLQQIRAAQLARFERRYFKASHSPYPLKKKTIEDFFLQRPNCLRDNIKYRFRSTNQYAPTILANHLEIAKNKAVYKDLKDVLMICFNRDGKNLANRKISSIESGGCTFLCVQSLEQADDEQVTRLKNIFDKQILS